MPLDDTLAAKSLEGQRLGPYHISALIGTGGMGEVYRARDTRLGREVAVKVLPADLSQNPEALARFEREARAVAALSHSNILAIHDFGQHEDTVFAVMELLEGARSFRAVAATRKDATNDAARPRRQHQCHYGTE